ncbi:MAG TPA: hypothetical protein VFJ43_08865, partial [Bacteroidia bacterium]|nr:hypothetical protein [Bacteroidia bacterium]
YDHDSFFSFKRIGKGLSVLFKGLFPIPDFTNDHPWNSNLIVNFSKSLAVIPAALAWFIPCILLKRNKGALLFFYFTAICLAFFIYYSPLIVASRHCGFFFLLLIVAMWLVTYYPESGVSENRFRKFAKPVFIFILFVQVISGIYLYAVDWSRPFSNGKAVAEWCRKNVSDSEIIVVNDHSAGPPIVAYLGRKVYYAENNSFGSFCKWNTKPFIISQDTLLSRVYRLLDQNKKDGLFLITNRPLSHDLLLRLSEYKISPLIEFENALVRSENYSIYSVKIRIR